MSPSDEQSVEDYMTALLHKPLAPGLDLVWKRLTPEAKVEVTRRLEGRPRTTEKK